MKRERSLKLTYVAADALSTVTAVTVADIFRYYFIRYHNANLFDATLDKFLFSPTIVVETIGMTLLLMGLYWLTGFYSGTIHRSRLQVVGNTVLNAAVAVLMLFFTAMLNDMMPMRRHTYQMLLVMTAIIIVIVGVPRWIIAWRNGRMIHSRRISTPTLVVGAGVGAREFARRLDSLRKSMGFDIRGFIDIGDSPVSTGRRPVYPLEQLEDTCRCHDIASIILSPAHKASLDIPGLLERLMALEMPLLLRPDISDSTVISPRFSNVCGEPLVDISRPRINPALVNLKRVADFITSSIALIVLSPLMAALAIAVRLDTPGPALYRQQRVGYHGRRFDILKFRSMVTSAENGGPALSSANDPRVTRTGRFMRKYRLDELPNLVNVWRGDMSLVGPRPEREYFARQLRERVPAYSLLQSVKPGLTSWGMVKFGYAGSLDEMVERLKYDLLYVENMSIAVDLKILFYTVHTVITGKGV